MKRPGFVVQTRLIIQRNGVLSLLTRTILAAVVTAMSVAYANAQQQFQSVFSGFKDIGGLGTGETGAIYQQAKARLG